MKNYYFSSFFWSTLQRVFNAILGFISVPLLLGYYGKAEYGILAIATACNAYMHLLDLGINVGAIKYFAQWRKEEKNELINRVARTNITFYLIISVINALGLLSLAVFGESLFSVSHSQFVQLRWCLLTLCLFSPCAWITTVFNQLLVADKRIDFTMKIQCLQTILKACLIFVALYAELSLSLYFFLLTLLISLLFIPYSFECRKEKLIDSLIPGRYWKDFQLVFRFSLSIFALSLFQMTATSSRPIILSIFCANGAETVADFRILEVVPSLIIMIGGQFAAIFLPHASSLVASKDKTMIENFAYNWTVKTSIISNFICIPFIICASEILAAYVGTEYKRLSIWLAIWCTTILCNIHTTPGNSLLLATGKTKVFVVVTAVACLISVVLNIFLCHYMEVGAAIVAYSIFIIITVGIYYVYYYNRVMGLSSSKMLQCFIKPTACSIAAAALAFIIPFDNMNLSYMNERLAYIIIIILKTSCWAIFYISILAAAKIVNIKEILNTSAILKP